MSAEIVVSRHLEGLPDTFGASSDEQLLEIWLHGRSASHPARLSGRRRAVSGWGREVLAAGDPVRSAGVRRLPRRSRPGQPVPHSLGRQISAGVRSPCRVPALRCRPRPAVAGCPQPPGRAHPARGGPAPHSGPGVESPQPGHPHPALCFRRARQRTVRTLLAGLAAQRGWRPDHRLRQRRRHPRDSGARFGVETARRPSQARRPIRATRSSAPARGKTAGCCGPWPCCASSAQSARRAGIELPVSPHWFRHAHASHALDRGAPIHLVQATLGHASITTTGRYLHARPNDSSSRFLPL